MAILGGQATPTGRTVIIVDDDRGVRSATARLLEREGYTVRCFDNGEAFLADGLSQDVAGIILDNRLPGISGLEILRALELAHDGPPVIMLTGHGDIGLAVEAMKLGASDFLEKPYRAQQLIDAIANLQLQEERPRVSDAARRDALEKVDRLTTRQREVLRGIALGEPNKLIAHRLGLSVRTVEAYRGQLMERLGVRSTAESVRIALLAGLLEPVLEA